MLGNQLALFGEYVLVDLIPTDPLRCGPADVHGDVVGRLLELDALGNEIRLTCQSDQHTEHWSVVLDVDVVADRSLGRLTVGPLGHLRLASLAEQLVGLLHVTVGFGEGLLRVHHADSCVMAELLNLFGGDFCHLFDTYLIKTLRFPAWPASSSKRFPCLR